MRSRLDRRSILAGVAACLLGCGAAPATLEVEVVRPPQPNVIVERLSDLVPAAGLEWIVSFRPQSLIATDWLRPALARIFKDERLDALAQGTGIQLREVPELALASFRLGSAESCIGYFVRHRADPVALERKFRERLTSDAERRELGHQLVAVWGSIGRAPHGFVAIGPEVVGYQYGGDRRKGPARIALMYADGRLRDVPSVSRDESLAALVGVLGDAPVRAILVGPFEGAMARGARGLLGAATHVGATLASTDRETLALRVAIAGDYSDPKAVTYLEGAWSDLAASDLGHLMGLGSPRAPVSVHATPAMLELATEVDATALLAGLAAATSDNVRDIMR